MFLNVFLIILVIAAGGAAAFLFFKLSQKIQDLKRLTAEESRLESIISSMNDGVIIYDQDFKMLFFSPAAEDIFNLKAKEILNQKIVPENAGDPRLAVLTKIIYQSLAPSVTRQSPEGVYPQIVDISFTEPHLELRVISDRVKDETGQQTGFLKIIQNRTRELDLLKSKNEFITVAAHQLRTPLSAVSWAYQSLKNENLTDSQKDIVNAGLAAANNLIKIVEDLLNISKIEEGRFGYNFQKIDLVAFLQSVLDQAAPVAKEYGVQVYMEPPKESPLELEVDAEKLGLAVSNLLENAIKYNVPNGQVVVSAEKQTEAPFLEVKISDTGLGIPPEAMAKLFTKFFRADNALTKETAGSGLGLYIVKNIINRHGGQIWAESELKRGSVFHFTLPLDPRFIPQREIKSS